MCKGDVRDPRHGQRRAAGCMGFLASYRLTTLSSRTASIHLQSFHRTVLTCCTLVHPMMHSQDLEISTLSFFFISPKAPLSCRSPGELPQGAEADARGSCRFSLPGMDLLPSHVYITINMYLCISGFFVSLYLSPSNPLCLSVSLSLIYIYMYIYI